MIGCSSHPALPRTPSPTSTAKGLPTSHWLRKSQNQTFEAEVAMAAEAKDIPQIAWNPETGIQLAALKEATFPPTYWTYNPRDLILYNLGLGAKAEELHLVFELNPNFHAIPTYGCIPGMIGVGTVTRYMPQFLSGFNVAYHVHGEHYTELLSPIPTGGKLRTESKVVDVVDRGKGVTVLIGLTTYDESGKKIVYNEWTSFVMKVPGKGASKAGGAPAIPPVPTDRAPDVEIEEPMFPSQGALYRAAANDLNPLHIDPDVAKRGGFARPILTGTGTFGIAGKKCLQYFGNSDPLRFKSIRGRFTSAVYHGETFKIQMWKAGTGPGFAKIIYQVSVKERGVKVLNGIVEIWDEPRSKI
ncbi:hydroxysteroid dehydrogenase [Hyaloraphidium curvatum]|nr:hydroxysteroid dehydrogenase [Hyaloraphidium curvatum]